MMVLFWIPTILLHLIVRVPKKGRMNFDNHPNGAHKERLKTLGLFLVLGWTGCHDFGVGRGDSDLYHKLNSLKGFVRGLFKGVL